MCLIVISDQHRYTNQNSVNLNILCIVYTLYKDSRLNHLPILRTPLYLL